ncbi:Rrf2 family transcriptional regulator [bacterium]|nr:Rrf2 family transcriptional regulator [bacterium]
MKISYKGDYSLKVILDLSQNYPNELVHIEEIAKRQDIPKKFLEQILLELKKGGFVQSKKGPNGGYVLTKKPEEITLGEVIRYIDGPIFPISCVNPHMPTKSCKETDRCVFNPIWGKVSEKIANVIDSIDFKQLTEKANNLKEQKVFNYYI